MPRRHASRRVTVPRGRLRRHPGTTPPARCPPGRSAVRRRCSPPTAHSVRWISGLHEQSPPGRPPPGACVPRRPAHLPHQRRPPKPPGDSRPRHRGDAPAWQAMRFRPRRALRMRPTVRPNACARRQTSLARPHSPSCSRVPRHCANAPAHRPRRCAHPWISPQRCGRPLRVRRVWIPPPVASWACPCWRGSRPVCCASMHRTSPCAPRRRSHGPRSSSPMHALR
jgi:hypothetical protein